MCTPSLSNRMAVSLVELLVTVAILGILLALAVAFVPVGMQFASNLEARANSARKHVRTSPPRLGSKGQAIGNQFIVVLVDGADARQELQRLSQLAPMNVLHLYTSAFAGFAIKMEAAAVPVLLADPAVRYVEQDQTLVLASLRSGVETERASLGLRRINGWSSSNPERTINADIAILDTGVDETNRDLNVVFRKSFVSADNAKDVNGHGTQVACVAAARANRFGVIGAAPGARIWALKVAADNNTSSASNLIAAIEFVITRADEIDVANVSVLTSSSSVAVNLAAANCVAAGVTVVAAAGNNQRDAASCSPGGEPHVISVGALADTDSRMGGKGPQTSAGDADDTLASFSNFGPLVDFLAPGVGIETLDLDNELSKGTGTSFAAAHVAGLAAVLHADSLLHTGSASPALIEQALLAASQERIPARGQVTPYPVVDGGLGSTNAMAANPGLARTSTHLPLSYELNLGQTNPQVRFLARAKTYTAFLTAQGAVLSMPGGAHRIQFANANPNPTITPQAPLPGIANYFIGNDPSRWLANVPTFGKILYQNIYPGIDAVFHSESGHLRYDLVVGPGADPAQIVLEFPNAQALQVERNGSLRIANSGSVSQSPPVLFQVGAYGPESVRGRYVAVGPKQVRFEVGLYDRSRPLVIDPVIFSTYLGGAGREFGLKAAIDASNYIYVTGATASSDFPITAGSFQPGFGGVEDVVVCKLDPTGSTLLYSTYLGGPSYDGINFGHGLAVDGAGNAYLCGSTQSSGYPTTPGAYQTKIKGGRTGFVTKINPSGNGLVYSTFLGGTASSSDETWDLALDAGGNVYLTGIATSNDFPTTPGAIQSTHQGGTYDTFVTKLNAAGSALVYSTRLGGTGLDWGRGITVDGAGNAVVTGHSASPDFPISPGAVQPILVGAPNTDVFVTKLNASGTGIIFSTFLGGTSHDEAHNVVLDAAGNCYVTGWAQSNYPTTPGVIQPKSSSADAFVSKLNPAGTALLYSTFLGSSGFDEGFGLAVDGSGQVYVGGKVGNTIPVVNALQPAFGGGGSDAFVMVLNPTATSLLFSTHLGGSGADEGRDLALDSTGSVVLIGRTTGGFPTVAPLQGSFGGGTHDIFVTRLNGTFSAPKAGVTIAQTAGTTTVTEGGPTDTYSVVLNTAPTSNVTVTLSPDSQVTVSPTVLTFTPGAWSVAQTVTVTAVDDAAIEGAHSGTIGHSATSSDPSYAGVFITSVSASITDNDAAASGVTIVETGGSTNVVEGGATDSYTIVLKSAPTANVTITLTPGPQVTVSPSTLTFFPGAWSVAQAVTVTAIDDAAVEGPHSQVISHAATSTDKNYSGIAIPGVTASITDNDAAGVIIAETAGATKIAEGGAADTYTIVLASAPSANVIITLTPDTQATVVPTTLTFTPGDWSKAQTVTVTAVDDTAVEANPHTAVITHTAASSDGKYAGITISNVTATVTENDFPPPDPVDSSDALTYPVLLGTRTITGQDTMKQPNGKMDDDWFGWTMGKTGTFTFEIKNIKVIASGPQGQYTFGDLHFRIYRINNGTLQQVASSQDTGAKSISIPVSQNERILVWVYGLFFTQATYDVTADLK